MLWAIVTIIVVWLIIANSNRASKSNLQGVMSLPNEEDDDNTVSEEALIKIQSRFEERLEQTYLPDSIRRSDLYVYKNLMRVWFSKLSSKHRYDEKLIEKIRIDWSNYMQSLEDAHTYNYLSMETYGEDEQKSEDYGKKAEIAHRKIKLIEDGFASAVGEDAVVELSRIRKLDFNRISRDGELAPEGFEFDFDDKLKPIKDNE